MFRNEQQQQQQQQHKKEGEKTTRHKNESSDRYLQVFIEDINFAIEKEENRNLDVTLSEGDRDEAWEIAGSYNTLHSESNEDSRCSSKGRVGQLLVGSSSRGEQDNTQT